MGGLLAVLLLGCDRTPSGGGDAAVDAGKAAPVASASHAPPPPPAPRPPPQPCKAATVIGQVTVAPLTGSFDGGGVPVLASAVVPDDAWIDVGKDGKLTARDAESTRETSYEGPGRFRVCLGHKEESWVASGTFESVGGAGERPGAEQWVATPLGAARYDVAKWKMRVTEKAVDVEISAGTAYFWASEGVASEFTAAPGGARPETNDQGWVRLDSGTRAKMSVTAKIAMPEAATAAVERCSAAAKEAMTWTAALSAPGADLAAIAPKDIVARRIAHAACAMAHLRAEGLPLSPVRDAALERVRAADAGWKALTAPAGHPGAAPPDPPAPSGGH